MARVPDTLKQALAPVTVVAGHYGAGKTNLCVNLAIDEARGGKNVCLIDLDVVNPYFRATEQRDVLEAAGVRLISPVFAEAGSSLDVPSLRGTIVPALEWAHADPDNLVIVDAGGDDVGATALGRFSRFIDQGPYALLYVVNDRRNLTQHADEALEILAEIEQACRLSATAVVSNAHLKAETTRQIEREGADFAREVARRRGVPFAGFTDSVEVPACDDGETFDADTARLVYPVTVYVKSPWE